ncbi:MAG: tRNA preQ1(34) S-adenosylmethionine ribosyltransferase-isomerase QueA [Capsulimonadaceae bacterium]|nr:tRNA preQ1(34) S-adenosylmethionine ribosyltransferase-isomerase QueA [Capsulimonadaceae bacterium]
MSDFDYALPKERIAQTAVEPRDSSRLLLVNRETGQVAAHRHFYDLPEYLRAGDLLVLNETRVNALRLRGHRQTGGIAEVFLTHRIAEGLWRALVKPGKSLREGATVSFDDGLVATVTGIVDERGSRTVQFTRDGHIEGAEELIDRLGRVPLPPYIADSDDDQARVKRRYQTVYAREPGSAAAPTAGLHFTDELLGRIANKGIRIARLTLHVGVGTFLPIVADDLSQHTMHSEAVSIPQEAADAIASAKGRIIGVGTTVLRALESAATGSRTVQAGRFETSLFVRPGFEFRIVDSLITNFHMPKSTLLVLTAAFAGREAILSAYATALKEDYRFLSFGDAMFIASDIKI